MINRKMVMQRKSMSSAHRASTARQVLPRKKIEETKEKSRLQMLSLQHKAKQAKQAFVCQKRAKLYVRAHLLSCQRC
mgnify:CR=1 FL=1